MRSFSVSSVLALVLLVAACEAPPPPPPDDDDDTPPGCTVDEECAVGTLCIAGDCVDAPQCRGIDDWAFCVDAVEAIRPGEGRTAWCAYDVGVGSEAHCRVGCETDAACKPDSLCTDFGACVPGLRRTPRARDVGAHATLLAGVGEAILDIPATTSLGGLASRSGSGDGAWAAGMDASVGHLEGLWARAAVLDAGDGRTLLIRLPMIFPGSALTEAIAFQLERFTGDDWRDALVVSTTHNHSGPARFLPLLRDAEDTLGPFGVGTFRQEVFDRFVASATEAALQAIEAQQPARLGWTIVEGFDTDDLVTGDRRSESPPFDDNRALLIRVDDDAGVPLFVVTGFGIHPTENGSNWATNDVVGGVERALEGALFPIADRVVPVLFVNGNGGSQSPAAGGRGFAVPHGNEATGAVVVDKLLPSLLAIETVADVEIAARAHRFHVTLPLLGYAPGEWANDGGPPFGGEIHYGGLNCFRDVPADVEPFDGALTRETMDCGIPLHTVLFNRPPSMFQRTQISAVSIAGLSILTLPGELTMELGWGIAAELERRAGIDPLSLFTMGYANDHLMYLLPTSLDEDAPPWPGYAGPAPRTYPPHAFSPLRGGFEADTSLFGDLMGDHLVEESMVAWQRLIDGTPAAVEVAPAVYSVDVKPPIPVVETSPDRVGTVIVELPTSVPRRAPTPFTFVGGDVAIEGHGPTVSLVKSNGGPVLLPSGRAHSTDHAVFPLSVKRVDGEWRWTALLELPASLPAGDYKLVVTGKAQDDGVVATYTSSSALFSAAPAPLTVTAFRDGTDLVVRASHASEVPTITDSGITGRVLLVDPRVRSGGPSPIASTSSSFTVRDAPGVTCVPEEIREGDGFVTQCRFAAVAAGGLDVDVVDAVGNRGSVEVAAVE